MKDTVLNRTTSIFYDLLGRPVNMDEGNGAFWRYAWDVNGNLRGLRAVNGGQTNLMVFTYDKDNRETGVQSFGRNRTTAYD